MNFQSFIKKKVLMPIEKWQIEKQVELYSQKVKKIFEYLSADYVGIRLGLVDAENKLVIIEISLLPQITDLENAFVSLGNENPKLLNPNIVKEMSALIRAHKMARFVLSAIVRSLVESLNSLGYRVIIRESRELFAEIKEVKYG